MSAGRIARRRTATLLPDAWAKAQHAATETAKP